MPVGSISQAIKLITSGITVDSTFSYHFAASLPSYYTSGSGFTVTGYSLTPGGSNYVFSATDFVSIAALAGGAMTSATAAIERVAAVSFNQQSTASADIVIGGLSVDLHTAALQAAGFTFDPMGINPARSDIWITQIGQAAFSIGRTIQHELLHALGLGDAGLVYSGDENSGQYTVMSYLIHPEENRVAVELQLYDVAALQAIYGRDDGYASGNTTISQFTETSGDYAGSNRIFAIWDGGGEDTIDASSLSNSALIDLRPGHFSSIGPNARVNVIAGTNPTAPDDGRQNISIAFGAYIENAKGSSAGDLLIGNILTNKLEGGAGEDVIYAEGIDSIHEAGHGSYDRVTSAGSKIQAPSSEVQAFIDDPASQEDNLLGGDGDDYLHGGRGNDLIEGGDHDDHIIGGGGDDEIWGGDKDTSRGKADGIDTVDYSGVDSRVSISFTGEGGVGTLAVIDGEGGNDTLHSIERIVASAHSDYLSLHGEIPASYAPNGTHSLTIDMGDGTDVIANAAEASGRIVVDIDDQGNGTATSPETGGVIKLLNAKTTIIGSAYDDEITDLAEHDGVKRIDGGGGDDVIAVDGSDARIRGGAGDDEIDGGEGNDILRGGTGTDIVRGGGGSDHLANHRFEHELGDGRIYDSDELEGGDGHDYLELVEGTVGGTLTGGLGKDVIDARGGFHGIVRFGAGDGHDMILSNREAGNRDEPNDGISLINFGTLSKSDVTFVWDPQLFLEDHAPNGTPIDIAGTIWKQGDLAIKINATGDTILLKNIVGLSSYWNSPDEAFQPPFTEHYERFHLDLPPILFADGLVQLGDFNGANPVLTVQFGSVAAYATALDDYRAATAGDPDDSEGTAGDDDLPGSQNDDAIDGGDGDDNFQSSGGQDTVDGGAGSDSLFLFGALADYIITRDEATGAVTVEDRTGLEGKLTLTSVESLYFAADNENYAPEEIVGYWGTAGNDTLTGSWRGNHLYGLGGDDSLSGMAGDDLLDGGSGDNALDGGDGIDTADYSDALAGVTVSLAFGTASGNGLGGADTLTAIENLVGSAFADALTGDGGGNRLDGGAGADSLVGGDGDDVYVVDDPGDVVTENAGEGSDTIVTGLAVYTLGAHVENLAFVGEDAFTGTGNALANLIAGGAGDDVLSGGDGDDSFTMSWGEDAIDGGDGVDTIRFAGSIYAHSYSRDGAVTTISGWEGTAALTGVEMAWFEEDGQAVAIDDLLTLTVTGTAGNDAMLEGSALANAIHGLDGDDTLWGKAGADTLNGGNGSDTAYYAGSSADYAVYLDWEGNVAVADFVGNDGYDLLIGIETLYFDGDDVTVNVIDLPEYGTSGNDAILGSSRRDVLFGNDGDDSLDGLAGNDTMTGGTGDDSYALGAGNDSLSDDDGDDTYLYLAGDGDDEIYDAGGADILLFGAGIAPADVIVSAGAEDSYVLSFDGAAGSIILWGALDEDHAIEEIRFDDQTIWTAQDLHDLAFAPPPMSAMAIFPGESGLESKADQRATGFGEWPARDFGMDCQIV